MNGPSSPLPRCAFAVLAIAAVPGLARAKDDPGAALALRYRHERVDQAGFDRDAVADTVRIRAGYRTGDWGGWSAMAEVDGVLQLGQERYNDTRNGLRRYPVIADPAGAEVNRLLVRHAGDGHSATFGRQRIDLDDQRFVGGVGWRQNEQTYDGVRVQWTPAQRWHVDYAWVAGINTVFGPDDGAASHDANPSDIEGDSHLLQLRFEPFPALSVNVYEYRLDLDNIAIAADAPPGTLSSRTTGLRAAGAPGRWRYAAAFARQREHAGNPWKLDSRYFLAELGYAFDRTTVRGGLESLGGADTPYNGAFQTPLATKHKFQGWADVFLTTPADGVEDRYVGATVPLGGGRLQGRYHDFRAARGDGRHGRELDLSYAWPFPGMERLDGLVKWARYRADPASATVDADKLWFQLQYAY